MTCAGIQVTLPHVSESKSSFCRVGGGLFYPARELTLKFYDVNHKPNHDPMNTSQFMLKSKRKLCGAVAASLLIGISQTHATQLARELWDQSSGNHPINGVHSNNVSSVGFVANSTWVTSPATNTSIRFDGWNLDWMIGNGDTLLPYTVNNNGGLLAFYGNDGNMNSSLINPDTGLPYGSYAFQSYATRALTPSSYINCNADGTYYFSVRFVGGGGWGWWSGDMGGGIGLASSAATNAHFVSVGWTRTSFLLEDGVTEAGKSAFVSAGTLYQAGITSHPEDSGGPYFPRAVGPAGALSNGGGFLLVGQLITTAGGACTVNVKIYPGNTGVPTDPNAITWDATYSFAETNVMTQFLVMQYGTGPAVQDAQRVGTTLGDVIGLELTGAPSGNPANTVYAGTTVTLSQKAGLNTTAVPMSFQWRSNTVDIVDATNATLVLSGTTTDFTANYSVTVSNLHGQLTSPETLITFLPAVPPYFLAQPAPVTLSRYVGAPSAQFTVVANGTPPYTYQWQHAGTNFGAPVITADLTNTLTIAPVTVAAAGTYSVTVTNAFGSTNSQNSTLVVLEPATNTYSRAVTTVSPSLYAYWRLDDNATTNNPTIYDLWGGNHGQVNVSDLSYDRITFGAAGAQYPTFAAPHQATALGTGPSGTNWQGTYANAWEVPYRLDLAKLPVCNTNMTFTMWVKGGVRLVTRNGYGPAYGLENYNDGNLGLQNALRFFWGAYNSTNGVRAAQWDTGVQVPQNEWAFVALVVDGTNATVHVGSKASYTSASLADVGGIPDAENGGYMTLIDSTTAGDSPYLTPLGLGRNPWPWAEGGNGQVWASTAGTWSDVAVFNTALTAGQVKGLFLAGNGLWIEGTPDGAGNLNLNWVSGFTLQEASVVTGPYTDIGAATPPYSVPIATTGNKFYRVKPVGF
jgi:hypothetical protein